MKRITTTALLLGGMGCYATQALAEGLEDKRIYIAPALTYTSFDSDLDADDDLGFQFSVGKPLTSWLNLELTATTVDTDLDGGGEYELDAYGISALLFPARERFPIFGLLSVMDTRFDLNGQDEDGYLVDVGIGALRQITAHGTSLRWEYRFRQNMADSEDFDDHVVTLGIQYPFGAPPAAPEPPPPPPPPPPPVTEAPPAPAPEITQEPIILQGVNFEFDKSTLTPEAKSILDGVSEALKGAEQPNTLIKGHTDHTGSSEYNLGLSNRRAESVKQYLIDGGIDGGKLSTKGYGEASPIAPNDTKEGRAQNRRVELQVLDQNPCVPPTAGDQVNENGCAQ